MDVSLVLGGSFKSTYLRKVSVYTISASNFFLSVVPRRYFLPEYVGGINEPIYLGTRR